MEYIDSPNQTAKRPRPIVSCLSCRDKKLKCDRRLPCSKCIRGGRASSCEYAPGQEPVSNGSVPEDNAAKRPRIDPISPESSPTVAVARFDELQARVQQLEHILKLQQAYPLSQSASQVDSQVASPAFATALTQHPPIDGLVWHQPISDRPLLNQFEGLQEFVSSLKRDVLPEELSMIASDLRALHSKTRQQKSREFRIYNDVENVLDHMERLLPPMYTCHALIECYFHYFENCTRVLHRGTMWTQVRAYFNKSLMPGKRAACLPVLLAVVSIASSLGTFTECDNPALNGQADGIGAYQLIRNYLDLLSTTKWKETSSLQLAALTLKFHKSSPLNDLETWNWCGQVARRAMTARLHHPGHGEKSIFETEVKKRLWLTILETDLTLSVAAGMPVNCPVWQGDLPANVNDGKLYPGIMDKPPNRSVEEWTDGICQHILAQSLVDRMTAYSTISLGTPATYDTMLEHTRHLQQILRDLPSPFRLSPGSDEASDTPHRLMAKMELDFLLRRPLNACYASWAAEMPLDDRYKEARIQWIQGCTISICFQDLFDPKYPMLDLPEPRGLWDYFYNVYWWDVEQYMLSNCLELQRLRFLHSDAPDVPSPAFHGHASRTPIEVKGWSIDSITASLEEVVDPLIRRVGRHGSNLREVIIWTAIVGSLRVNPTCSRQHAIKNELQSLVSTLKNQLRIDDSEHRLATEPPSDPRSELSWLQRCFVQPEGESASGE